MKIYLINQGIEASLPIDISDIQDLSGQRYGYDNMYGLQHNSNDTIRKRGFPMSIMELDIYTRHYYAWKDLADSGEEYALILENVDSINVSTAELEQLVSTFDEGWSIYFPFDGYARKGVKNTSCMLGFRWGTDAYFIHRSCLEILLAQKQVLLPVDEQLLVLNQKNLLDIYYEDLPIFTFGDNSVYELDYEKSKLEQVLQINVWSEKDKESIRNLLSTLCTILNELEIDYFISEGTLLGHIRHGQIMAWDDDLDISIAQADMDKLVKYLDNSRRLKITKCFWGRNKIAYYKIWHFNTANIAGYSYGFPFIDVWNYEKTDDNIVYNFGSKYPIQYVFPTVNARFEGSMVSVPKDPLKYLDLKYKDWREKIVVYRWNHQLEKPSLFPLSIKISVNDNGLWCI